MACLNPAEARTGPPPPKPEVPIAWGRGRIATSYCEPSPARPLPKTARGGSLPVRSTIVHFSQKKISPHGGGTHTHTPPRLRLRAQFFSNGMAFRAEVIAAAQVPDAEKRSGAFREREGKLWVSRAFLPAGGGATWHRTGGGGASRAARGQGGFGWSAQVIVGTTRLYSVGIGVEDEP